MLAAIHKDGSRAVNVEKERSDAARGADRSHNWQEEDSWLELASAWAELADAFENQHRLSLN